MARWGLLLVNLGTPDAPDVASVRRYLRAFLSDPRVIDLPSLPRKLLLELVILPRRPKQSAEAYRKIWTERGSPLLFHGEDLTTKARERLGDDVHVELAMRYRKPSVAAALQRFAEQGTRDVVVFALYPQYSDAANGSTLEHVRAQARRMPEAPRLHEVPAFFDHPAYVAAVAAVSRPVLDDFVPDHVLMSYHGLPERHLTRDDPTGGHCLARADCCDAIGDANRNCYRAHCHATTRALVRELGLVDGTWEVAFQPRLGRPPWIRPYMDERVRALATGGVRRLAVLAPSFVADCLETLEEIGIRAAEDFRALGGEELRLVQSLNAEDVWADAACAIASEHAPR